MGEWIMWRKGESEIVILGPVDEEGEAFEVRAFGLFSLLQAKRLASELAAAKPGQWVGIVGTWRERFEVCGSVGITCRFVDKSGVLSKDLG